MATTPKVINELYNETINYISETPNNWLEFLKTASMNYTNSFSEQLLIYAQRPEAVSCTDIKTWNEKYKRLVNKGTTGIGLLVEENGRYKIKYVWGFNETHPMYKEKNQLKIWKVTQDYENKLIESLENKYGVLNNNDNFVETIKSVAINLTEDNYSDYLINILDYKNNSKLEKLSEDEIKEKFKNLLKNSIAYMTINRSGYEPAPYFNENEFQDINLFQDLSSMAMLGTAISDIAKMEIKEIYTSLKKIQISEKNVIRTFGKVNKILYDGTIINERRDIYENNLQTNGGLQDTRLNSNERGASQFGQVFNNETSILKEEQERTLSNDVDERNSQQSLDGNRGDSETENINNDREDESRNELNRGIESDRPNEMDRINEQLEDDSRGSSNQRTNFQLEDNENAENGILFSTDDKYQYKVGDKVYIGLDEYEITKIGLFDIELYCPSAPLFSKVMNIDEFETKLKENPANEHLIVKDTLETNENYYGEDNDEVDLVEHILNIYKIDDMQVSFNSNENISMWDDDNSWEGTEVFDFILDELLVYNEDGTANLVDNNDLRRLKEYRKKYEVKEQEIENLLGKKVIIDNVEYSIDDIGLNVATLRNNSFQQDGGIPKWKDVELDRVKELLLEQETSKQEENKIVPAKKEKTNYQQDQLSLFTPREQELADRIVEELNSLETKYKGTFYADSIELKKWDHIKSNKRNLTINIKSDKCTGFNETSFTQFNTDKTDEIILRESVETNAFLKYLNEDKDFDIYISPELLTVFWHNFDEKQYDLSFGKDNVLSSLNDIDNTKQIETPVIKKNRDKVVNYVLHPEIPMEDRNQFRIQNNDLGEGTPKERFKNNIEAIKVLKRCEEENRFATKEEQVTLSKYVGWGGLPQAFDKEDSSWNNEYNILKNLLDETEYKEARESTLTAFYTPPVVIKAMYKALSNMGLEKGNILEPSCGIGNFIGLLPNNDNLKIYGVELDSISGRIARQLYQKSSIAVQGYEDTNLPDSFFDVAIGNVPFGDFKVLDKKYDKYKFLIHDYFFAKTLDKIRPGGVIAFITSKGTLDKQNSNFRKYIAQRADLLGAIRLPNDTFKKSAGTEVTSDIIFLQKRDSITDIEPDWVHLEETEEGIAMNKYFIDNPDMILGNIETISTRFGSDIACISDGGNLEDKLEQAILNIKSEIKEYELDDIDEVDNSIEADLTVRNFSYTIKDDKIYYRENSRMYPQNLAITTENRVKGLIELRDCVRNLIELQTEDYPEEDIKKEQLRLNQLYDKYTSKYGLINSRGNNTAFSNDSSYYLLCSLEILDENGNLARKADMFTKRTIKPKVEIKSVDNANDALIVSISEKARVDIEFMQKLCGLDMDKMIEDLEGVIFNVPEYGETNHWVTADEYLSGNVREKLKIAEKFAETDDRFNINVKCLKQVIPKDLGASEISVRLGTTWIPPEDIRDFIFYLLEPDYYLRDKINVHYMTSTSEWYIDGKNSDNYNAKVKSTYGTKRVNAYKIIEDSLNLRDTKVYDYYEEDGKKKAELNKKETAIAQSKQEQIKLAFEDWIWKDQSRRERLVRFYNDNFNCIRPREYDGSHIKFEGMNPEITLRPHQINAIARILYGGNTLLAHEVGAGKTYEMVASAMESKRLGLCNKSLFVVPNHIVEQFGQEFLQLYPSANILVTTKKDFETSNRKKFCSRIATGDYDAIIISHSQFEKIPMSIERQTKIISKQIEDITFGIEDLKNSNGERFSIKQMEKTKKQLEAKLDKLNDTSRKDDVITFEELGVDRLFVDEAHYYKNLFLYTKMKNVGGIAQTDAQKSSDLFMKCRYLDELTGGKGVIFATGTPVSNTMVELYTMQRYLQYGELEKRHLENFDSWASTFGKTTTAIELSPEGTGYRAKTRFSKFFNLPELMSMFKEVADIQTSDTLNLPVPKANYHNIVVKPSEVQKELVKSLAERAEKIRNKLVDPTEDNMLKITNDGRKLALDQRLINDFLEDYQEGKVATCANNIYDIWTKTAENKSAQLVFCDLSTPHNDGNFNVYDDLKEKLIERGIPEEEIAYIHNANTEAKKQELFNKVRRGNVRVLIGSTQKMGAGTNCQDRLIALHDLDCPWRPSDLIQRSGRIIRQGNMNPEVEIYRYVTEGTFDAYLYQLVENKQRFISQIMTSKTPVRFAEDIDETALSYAEIKALAAGNPDIIEKTELDNEVAKLKLLKQNHLSQIYDLQDKIVKYYPSEKKRLENYLSDVKEDLEIFKNNSSEDDSFDKMILDGVTYTDKNKAGDKLLEVVSNNFSLNAKEIGEYKGFKLSSFFDKTNHKFYVELKNKSSYRVELGHNSSGNILRIDNRLNSIEKIMSDVSKNIEDIKRQFEVAKEEVEKPFPFEDELKEKTKRLNELNIKLNLNKEDKELIDDGIEETENCQIYKKEYAR